MTYTLDENEIKTLGILASDKLQRPSNVDCKYFLSLIDRAILTNDKNTSLFARQTMGGILKHLRAKLMACLKAIEKAEKKRSKTSQDPVVTHPLNKPLETTAVDNKAQILETKPVYYTEIIKRKGWIINPQTRDEFKDSAMTVMENSWLTVREILKRLKTRLGITRAYVTVYTHITDLVRMGKVKSKTHPTDGRKVVYCVIQTDKL